MLNLAGHTGNINGLSARARSTTRPGGTLVMGNNNATSAFTGLIENTGGTLALVATATLADPEQLQQHLHGRHDRQRRHPERCVLGQRQRLHTQQRPGAAR